MRRGSFTLIAGLCANAALMITVANAALVLDRAPPSLGKSCKLTNYGNQTELIKAVADAVYQVVAKNSDGSEEVRGTALAIDRRGYFITAMHAVYRFEDDQIVLRQYDDPSSSGSVSQEIPVKPIARTKDYNKLDFALLEAIPNPDVSVRKRAALPKIAALPVHLSAEAPGISGFYIGYKKDGHLGQIVHISPPSNKDIEKDQVTTFWKTQPVVPGHSGSVAVNDMGVAFATIHREFSSKANKQQDINKALELMLKVEGNMLARQAVKKRLMSIPPHAALKAVRDAALAGTLNARQHYTPLKNSINAHELSAIDALHFIRMVDEGLFLKSDKEIYKDTIFLGLQIAQKHCVERQYFTAMYNNLSKLKPPSQPKQGTDGKILKSGLRFPGLSEFASTKSFTQDQGFEDTIVANVSVYQAAEYGKSALRLSRKSDLDNNFRRFLLRSALLGLRRAEALLPPADGLDKRKNRYFGYVVTALAHAEYKLEKELGMSHERSSRIMVANPFETTPSGLTLLAKISQDAGLPDAAHNFDSKAIKRYAEIVGGGVAVAGTYRGLAEWFGNKNDRFLKNQFERLVTNYDLSRRFYMNIDPEPFVKAKDPPMIAELLQREGLGMFERQLLYHSLTTGRI